ncbi:MAG TPA: DsbA family oxidoreductase [Burkholderiaceae bacterium]|nr:DsbA family oxidoreductase [Burkholderiaceae bacterium]
MNPILEPAGEALRIDVISDVVCPWCYVGKRQLESALRRWQEDNPQAPQPLVRWHPFQLNPELAESGMARADYMKAKFGSSDPAAIYERVRAAAKGVGLELRLERVARQPNTLRAHALIASAATAAGTDAAIVESLFRGYFVEGVDLTDPESLVGLAAAAGMPEAQARAALDDTALLERTAQADAEARRLGVSGVPFFVIDGRVAVSGAQGADALLSAIAQARGATA